MSTALPDGVTLTVEAALSAAIGTYGAWDAGLWDTATWGPADLFVDISDYVRSFSTNRRFGREVAAWESGTAQYVLSNLDGRFSMDNLTGPYVTGASYLNANPYFETDVSNWTPTGVTSVQSTALAHEGVASMLITPDGVTSGPKVQSEDFPVVALTSYTLSGWMAPTAGGITRSLSVAWKNAAHVTLSTDSITANMPTADTWLNYGPTAFTAPVGAVFASITAGAAGVLSTPWYLDEVTLGGPTSVRITELRPWRPIRQLATYAGITYPIYRGYAQDWIESYPMMAATGKGDAIVSVPCVDELAKLAGYNGPGQVAVGAGDLFGARIHRILNSAGHVGERAIEVGTTTMQATTLAQNAVSDLKLTADSEGGAVYIGADGAVIGEQQYALVQNTRSITSQVTFGDGGGDEIPYSDIELSGAGDLIVNIAAYARVGGTQQTVADNTSRALYGDRTDPRTDLICQTDAKAAELASWKVARFKQPERRVTSITIKPRRDPATMFPVALGLRVRDLVTVIRRPPPGGYAIIQYCHIAGISHQLTQGKERQWVTTFSLFSATPYLAFSQSLWDTGTWGATESDPTGARWFY